MKVHGGIGFKNLSEIPALAQRQERRGYDSIHSGEATHSGFMPPLLAAEHTKRIGVGTNIALAFPRSPTITAHAAWDIQALSGGRFALGLGTQVKGHIVRRFSSEWRQPVARLREYIHAVRAVWDSWQNGSRLNFHGDHYNLTLMIPFFNPGPIEHPNIPINISAVGPRMSKLAGETADGLLYHVFHTPKHLREVVYANFCAGAEAAGRDPKSLGFIGGGYFVTGKNDEELEKGREGVKGQFAFYGSTPQYQEVLDLHGWTDVAHKLQAMAKSGQWQEMAGAITDEIVDEFATVATYDKIADKIKERYGSFASSIGFSMPTKNPEDEEILATIIQELKS